MLPRSQRLQHRKVFDPLYRFGHTSRGKMLTVRSISFHLSGLESPTNRPAENSDVPSRIAVIVSKKVSRKAVERNRIKRRVRHQLQPLLRSIVPNHYIAISANRPLNRSPDGDGSPVLLTCSALQLDRELRNLLAQAGLLQERAPSSERVALPKP